jgi:hypothetical protein
MILEKTNVSFILTSLFGGNPNQVYNATWNFSFSDGTSLSSTNFNPTVWDMAVGSTFNASLTISQGSLIGNTVTNSVLVPNALSFEDVIISQRVVESSIDETTSEDLASGLIELEFAEGDFFHFWTSLEDPAFYSEEATIDSLVGGATYKLTTIDNASGTCRVDYFPLNAKILPVEMLALDAQFIKESRTSMINWATAKEANNSHFEIERSLNGINNFELIGQVEGMGWKDTITEYSFEDTELPLRESTAYYRIKQLDFNHSSSYSKVLSLQIEGISATRKSWRAYPNPLKQGERFKLSLIDAKSYTSGTISAKIISSKNEAFSIFANSEEELNEKLNEKLAQVSAGIILVEIQWNQGVEHFKIIKRY